MHYKVAAYWEKHSHLARLLASDMSRELKVIGERLTLHLIYSTITLDEVIVTAYDSYCRPSVLV